MSGALRLLEFEDGDLHSRVAARRVLHSAAPWVRPSPRLLLDLSGRSLPLQPLSRQQRLSVPKVLDTFEDAHLVWSDCFILGRLFQNSFAASRDISVRMLAVRDAGSNAQRTAGIVATAQGLAIAEEKLANAIDIPARVLFATPHEPHHWGLWLTASMVAIDCFRRNRPCYEKLFLHANHPNMQAMVEMMGIGEGEVIRHDVTRTYHFRSVDLLRTPRNDFHVYPDEHAIFRALAEAHGEGPPATRIFVSRRSRSRAGYRPLCNEDALIAALQPLGFTTIEPELLPVRVQMRLFAEAEAVVGLGGGGMFNAVFCKPGTKLLDIESTPRFLDRHANLFASLGLDYGMIVGAEDMTDPNALHRRWHLDIEAAMPHVRRFLEL
jgi:hypothetical protein